MRRVTAAETSSTSASRISSGGTPSAAGEALQRFPATVPAILNLHRANFSCGSFEGIEATREREHELCRSTW